MSMPFSSSRLTAVQRSVKSDTIFIGFRVNILYKDKPTCSRSRLTEEIMLLALIFNEGPDVQPIK